MGYRILFTGMDQYKRCTKGISLATKVHEDGLAYYYKVGNLGFHSLKNGVIICAQEELLDPKL